MSLNEPKRHRRLPVNRGARLPPERLTQAEVRAIIDACPDTFVGVRNRALLVVMYRGGLKLGEALAAQATDVDPSQRAMTVAASRSVAFDAAAWEMLEAWIDRRGGLAEGPLFCTTHWRPLLPSYVRTWLPKLARTAGVSTRVHPQAFRHTFAGELVLEGRSPFFLRDVLGLASVASTETYIAELALPLPDPAAVLRTRPWSAEPHAALEGA